MVRNKDHLILDIDEHKALLRFNTGVMTGSAMHVNVEKARKQALKLLGHDIYALASAFVTLWPHWFLNGRKERIISTEAKCRDVCEEILCKLDAGRGPSIMGALANISGMSIVSTGKHTAAVTRASGSKRGYREMVMCKFHPEVRAQSRGLCVTCYGRWWRLDREGIDLHSFSDKAIKEVMAMEVSQLRRRGSLKSCVLEIQERCCNG